VLRSESLHESFLNSHAPVKREQELHESWWELRNESLHESFLNSHAPVKQEQELHESWWELRSERSHESFLNSHAPVKRELTRVAWELTRVEKREFAFSTLMPRSNENKSCIELHESWEARICMRVFSTLMPRSNENKSCMRVDESWEVRVCMRVFSTLVPRSNENKRCIELHESWLDITARVAKTALINSRQNLNQFKLMRVDERPCLLVSCS
jgi:hypothetical protein